jgi:hypothetical protein
MKESLLFVTIDDNIFCFLKKTTGNWCQIHIAGNYETGLRLLMEKKEIRLILLGKLNPGSDMFAFQYFVKNHPEFKSIPLFIIDCGGWLKNEVSCLFQIEI